MMNRREAYGAVYWRLWIGMMIAYGGLMLSTDFADDWPWYGIVAFGLGTGLIFDAFARVADRVHRYAVTSR